MPIGAIARSQQSAEHEYFGSGFVGQEDWKSPLRIATPIRARRRYRMATHRHKINHSWVCD